MRFTRRRIVLQPGERMVQYLIFGKPLDAVLDANSRAIAIITSYE